MHSSGSDLRGLQRRVERDTLELVQLAARRSVCGLQQAAYTAGQRVGRRAPRTAGPQVRHCQERPAANAAPGDFRGANSGDGTAPFPCGGENRCRLVFPVLSKYDAEKEAMNEAGRGTTQQVLRRCHDPLLLPSLLLPSLLLPSLLPPSIPDAVPAIMPRTDQTGSGWHASMRCAKRSTTSRAKACCVRTGPAPITSA